MMRRVEGVGHLACTVNKIVWDDLDIELINVSRDV